MGLARSSNTEYMEYMRRRHLSTRWVSRVVSLPHHAGAVSQDRRVLPDFRLPLSFPGYDGSNMLGFT